jgi:hypothetical protein
MHCMIAWGSPDPKVPVTLAEHERIEAILAEFSLVRAFRGSGVISITGNEMRLEVEAKLVAEIRASMLGRVQLLISPPMGPGNFAYRGFLPSGTWEPLNAKVQQ